MVQKKYGKTPHAKSTSASKNHTSTNHEKHHSKSESVEKKVHHTEEKAAAKSSKTEAKNLSSVQKNILITLGIVVIVTLALGFGVRYGYNYLPENAKSAIDKANNRKSDAVLQSDDTNDVLAIEACNYGLSYDKNTVQPLYFANKKNESFEQFFRAKFGELVGPEFQSEEITLIGSQTPDFQNVGLVLCLKPDNTELTGELVKKVADLYKQEAQIEFKEENSDLAKIPFVQEESKQTIKTENVFNYTVDAGQELKIQVSFFGYNDSIYFVAAQPGSESLKIQFTDRAEVKANVNLEDLVVEKVSQKFADQPQESSPENTQDQEIRIEDPAAPSQSTETEPAPQQ